MRLLRLQVENFGKLQNYRLELQNGLNILHEKNGWGKSTLAVFIKAMFYGLPAGNKRSLDENERKRYTPWQGGAFGGSLEFETAEGAYRIERFFGAKESGDSFVLYDLSTNRPTNRYSASIGVELFGIDADGFERSTYLSQRRLTGNRDNNSISAKLGDLLDDVGDIGNFDSAMEILDKRRRHYVMTGGRGAIAESEAKIVQYEAELAELMRKEEMMRDQEQVMERITEELGNLQRQDAENRAQLRRAGLARETAALLAQKEKMQAEIAELTRKKQVLEDYFAGEIPTDGDLETVRHLYEALREESARMEAWSDEGDPTETDRLRRLFANGVPSEATLTELTRQNEELQRTQVAYRLLRERQKQARERSGTVGDSPDPTAVSSALAALSEAEKMQKELAELQSNCTSGQKSGKGLSLLSVVLLVAGAALLVSAFIPALSAAFGVLLALGGVALLAGVILLIVSACKSGRAKAEALAVDRRIAELELSCNQKREGVRKLLRRFQMPTDDLYRSLRELEWELSRRAEEQQKNRQIEAEAEQVVRMRTKQSQALREALSVYFAELAEKADYQAELVALRTDAGLYAQLLRTDRERAATRQLAQNRIKQQKQQLLPFFKRYDPNGTMRAADCIAYVAAQKTEYGRLCAELTRKENELNAFVAEKLARDGGETVQATASFEELTAIEQDLQSRMREMQRSRAALAEKLERLSADTDRIPEMERQLSQLRAELTEDKANAATIQNTAKLLEEAKIALSTRYLDGMQRGFAQYYSELSGTDSCDSVMDTSFEVFLREGGKTRSMESFSRGKRDLAEFCVRLSLSAALYENEEPPFLLLDDPFVNFDDDSLAAARGLLERLATKYQILYLVCHKGRV